MIVTRSLVQTAARGKTPATPSTPRATGRRAARRSRSSWERDIKPRPISWLWPEWLAHGKLHIFAGRPGCLKTTTAIGFAAGVTVGGNGRTERGWRRATSSSGAARTPSRTRCCRAFIAAGGDPAHIAFIKGVEEDGTKRGFDPSRDMEALAEVCAELGGVNLIIIDPVVMIAKGDSHKNAETRRDLQPLVDLAERTQAAVIGIHHLTKRSEGADPVDRVSGSLAFGAAPRVILLSALDPKGGAEPRGVLMRAKSNIGPSHGGFAFSAEQRPLDDEPDISAQRILWGEYVDKSARDILEEFEGKAKAAAEKRAQDRRVPDRGARDRGPRMAAEVVAEGEKLGFQVWALRRALKKLGGTTQKPSFNTGWVWELPELVGVTKRTVSSPRKSVTFAPLEEAPNVRRERREQNIVPPHARVREAVERRDGNFHFRLRTLWQGS